MLHCSSSDIDCQSTVRGGADHCHSHWTIGNGYKMMKIVLSAFNRSLLEITIVMKVELLDYEENSFLALAVEDGALLCEGNLKIKFV